MTDKDAWWLQDDDDVAEPLTDEQVEELRKDLVLLQALLKEQIEAPSDRTETVTLDQPIGRLSRMDAMQQQKMAQAQRGRLRVRLSQIAVALRSFADDEYGKWRPLFSMDDIVFHIPPKCYQYYVAAGASLCSRLKLLLHGSQCDTPIWHYYLTWWMALKEQ